jgi:SAM-dependent methyltransferase
MSSTRVTDGTAALNGDLWGSHAHDWAEVQEAVQSPMYSAVFDRLGLPAASRLLDVGCGAGRACRVAADRGWTVSGIDAAATLIEIARSRTPEADFQTGEIEDLPYPDDSFDAVTGFNSFQYAARPNRALAEARRVAKPGAPVIILVWGRPEHCEAAAYIAALGRNLPAPPPGAPGPFALSNEDALRALAVQSGLSPVEVIDVTGNWEYADLDTALRGLLAAGVAERAIRHSGEAAVRTSVIDALAPFRLASGGYRLENEFRYLLARA